MSTLGERVQAYAAKKAEIDEAEEVLKGLKAEYSAQEEVLLRDYEIDGIQSMKVGDKSVHLYRDLYVKLVGDIDEAHEVLLRDYETDGIQNMRTVDNRTVYLHQDLYVKLVGDIDEAHDALRAAGGTDLLKYGVNASSLRAWVKELVASDGIPEGLQPFVETTDGFHIRVRRG